MARPREFDEAAVLDAAIQCFWVRGYEAASVRELAGSMGISGASLYNAFGDKHSLFARALDRYVETGFTQRIRRIEDHLPPRDAIAAFFSEIIERSLGDPQHKGCLLVNAALEVASHDPAIQRVVAGFFARVEAFFYRCVAEGQRCGTITLAQPAEDLARLLLGILVGVRVMARAQPDRTLLEGMVKPALALLDG
jgi:TetR/AcrR family transcriptional repressor of nem operon